MLIYLFSTLARHGKAFWNIKPLGPRIEAKVAKYGGLNQITDILRGSIIFETAMQMDEALDFLLEKEFEDDVVWVNNRLKDSVAGYRDVVLLIEVSK